MKKNYEKPALMCEDLYPEEMLCGCLANAPQFNEAQMCAYPVKVSPYASITVNIFMDSWLACNADKDRYGDNYCYHAGQTNIFSS